MRGLRPIVRGIWIVCIQSTDNLYKPFYLPIFSWCVSEDHLCYLVLDVNTKSSVSSNHESSSSSAAGVHTSGTQRSIRRRNWRNGAVWSPEKLTSSYFERTSAILIGTPWFVTASLKESCDQDESTIFVEDHHYVLTSLKECFCWIPQHRYHLNEMASIRKYIMGISSVGKVMSVCEVLDLYTGVLRCLWCVMSARRRRCDRRLFYMELDHLIYSFSTSVRTASSNSGRMFLAWRSTMNVSGVGFGERKIEV